MSIFKFRNPASTAVDSHSSDGGTPSLEMLKHRAWRRLIGAALLLGAAVLCFPLLFNTPPRALSQDIPIQIPERPQLAAASSAMSSQSASISAPSESPASNKPEDLLPPAVSAAAPAPGVSPSASSAHAVAATPAPTSSSVNAAASQSAARQGDAGPKAASTASAQSQAERVQADKGEPSKPTKTVVAAQEKHTAAKASVASSTAKGSKRYVIQAGAYSDAAKLREARSKLEKAGLKTYVQVVDSKEGKRTRVRVGPFESKEALDKAVRKIKALDLPAGVIELP